MMVLVHASPTTLERHRHPHLGVLMSPRRVYGAELAGWTWAADNDAFSKWNAGRFRTMLTKIKGRPGCRFVTLPDIVGDADATLKLFETWYDEVKATGQPVALVAQDGLTPQRVPWRHIDALFIGGSTEFKMGPVAYDLALIARAKGLWVHMGRVNSLRRIQYAKAIGCDSMDGTSVSWFRDTYLPQRLKDVSVEPQMLLESP